MAENPAAEPIDHGGEIDEAARHRDVRNIHGPDLTWPDGLHLAQQIGVDLVPWRRLARVRLAINRFDPHALHQRGDMKAADFDAVGIQEITQHPAARERKVEMQFIHPMHDDKIGCGHRPGQIIDAAPAGVQRLRLPGDRSAWERSIIALRSAGRPC